MAILNNNPLVGASGNQGGYNINNSLRFRSSASAYLSRTPASAGNRKTWTWSAWVKRGTLGVAQALFNGGTGTTDATWDAILFNSDNTLNYGGYVTNWRITTQVFRDPSAWYHIIVAFDTTQATAANRVKIYVNGSEVTSFSTNNAPTLNADYGINQAAIHDIGYQTVAAGLGYFDGYMAEVNFIDGQAKVASDFGETDTTTGVWKPKAYSGTYGTNGFYLPFKLNNTSTYAGSFNGSSQYLSAPDNTVFSWGTGSYTVECWIKTSTKTNYTCIAAKSNPAATDSWYIETDASGYIHYGGNGAITLQGTKDVCDGNWHHIAIVRNGSTNVTLYIDGISNVTASDTNAYTATGYPLTIGYLSSTYPRYFNGQISNFRIVKGAAVYTSNFVPSSTALTAISNTSILTLQNTTIIDNSTNAFTITNNGTVTTSTVTPFVANIASDNSSNNNNWIPNNINYTSSGTTYDAMTDVPTNTSATVANYCVLNPLDKNSSITLSNGNLTATGGSNVTTRATYFVSSGKWYWETTVTSASAASLVGIVDATASLASYVGSSSLGYGYSSAAFKYNNATPVSYGATFTTSDVVGIALDLDTGTIEFYKNNVSQGVAYSSLSGLFSPAYSTGTSTTLAFNFGQRPFAYTPPTGFVALNTFNLPTPTILQGNKYMDATLYSGNSTTVTATNAGAFKPDLVWIKDRTQVASHVLTDSVRGTSAQLFSNLTNAEQTNSTYVTSFNSNGFTVGVGNAGTGVVNNSGDNFVGWSWQAGQGSTSSGTGTGGITSVTQSVNTTAGFSIVTYTGSGANGTVTHGLGVAPKMIIVKWRSGGGLTAQDWNVYHTSVGATARLFLNTTAASATTSVAWNNTAPTSSVFSIGTGTDVNGNGAAYVAYCWAEIAGFSKFGSYTGNGSSDGPFVYTGFRPKFVMIKSSSVGGTGYHWTMYDTSRNTYNVADLQLCANLSDAEAVSNQIDILSNGFKIFGGGARHNGSGTTYIFMAFAENPFKNSLAR